MYAMERRAIERYASVGLETGVDAANPHKLVLMLFEGAILALGNAKGHMTRRDTAAKGAAMSKAIAIISEGLKASLDVSASGQLGERLASLYEYMVARLLAANQHDRPEYVDEVSRLLTDLRSAWDQIRPAAPLVSSPTAEPPAVATFRVVT